MRRGILAAAAIVLAACVTAKDSVGAGDARLDDTEQKDAQATAKKGATCGPEGKGDISLVDARTGNPLTCTQVTVTAEQMTCPQGSECPSDLIYNGFTNKQGLVLAKQGFSGVRLVASSDGFATSTQNGASWAADKVLEVELAPDEGYWLKVLDAEGTYLADVLVTFKRGTEVLAQLRSNDLANVFFTQRQPFAGEPVVVSADGYLELTVASLEDLGEDGHTLVLRK